MMRPPLPLAALLFLTFTLPLYANTTIFIVRHAEKNTEIKGVSQPLSNAGHTRSSQLAQLLQDVPLTAVYASTSAQPEGSVTIKRTWDTAQPIADQHELHTQGYPATDTASLTDDVLSNNKDEAVLIVGHSNTVPDIVRALGIDTDLSLTDDEYDDLFIITIDDAGNATLLHLHFGTPTP